MAIKYLLLAASIATASASASPWQFESTDSKAKVFWYLVPTVDGSAATDVKVQFQVDVGTTTSNAGALWGGIGFRTQTTAMGPGEFYTGQTDTLQVTNRRLTASTNTYPPPVADTDMQDQGCSVDGSLLTCSFTRPLTHANKTTVEDLTGSDIGIMYALGSVNNGEISIHSTKGVSGSTFDIAKTAAPLTPINNTANPVRVWYTELPGDASVDFHFGMDFTGQKTATPATSWIGVGIGNSSTNMGPGQFFTGQGNTLNVTDRFLTTPTSGPPPVNTNSDVSSSSCNVNGKVLACSLNRPAAPSKNSNSKPTTQIDLRQLNFVKWAWGPVTNGDIASHGFTPADIARSTKTVQIAAPSPSPSPSHSPSPSSPSPAPPAPGKWQYVSADGKAKVFWYSVPNSTTTPTVKFQFQIDVGSSDGAALWGGIGFGASPTTAMGPGEFYTGQTDRLQVVNRRLTTSTSTYPPPVANSDMEDQGCSVDGSLLTCSFTRPLTHSDPTTVQDLSGSNINIMYALGPVSKGDIGYHTTRGFSNTTFDIAKTAAPLTPVHNTMNPVQVWYTDLPGDGTVDFLYAMDFTGQPTATAATSWIGVGISDSATSMGAGQFFTGQGDTKQVTDRYLSTATSAYPPPNPFSDVTTSSCRVDGKLLACAFNRPASPVSNATQAATQVDLRKKNYVKWAWGALKNGDISSHGFTPADFAKSDTELQIAPAITPSPPSPSPPPPPPPSNEGRQNWTFTSNDNSWNAFWYVRPMQSNTTIKIVFQADFGTAPKEKWVGFGIRSTKTKTMGPGQFYTGRSDTHNVTARWLSASTDNYPPPAKHSDILDSGCQVLDTRLLCYVVRPITPDSTTASEAIDLAGDVQIMWAHGDISAGELQQHNAQGASGDVSLVASGPDAPMFGGVEKGSPLLVGWMPLPGDASVDMYFSMDYMNSGSSITDGWIGMGVSTTDTDMGPGQFYTAQGAKLEVTDRYLKSGSSLPPVNTDSNINYAECTADGIVGQKLDCTFNRPLAASGSTQVDLFNQVAYVKVAWGKVSGGDIQPHLAADCNVSTSAFNFTVANAAPLPPGPPADNTLFKAHGVLMIITWLFLLPFGIYVARFRDSMGMGKHANLEGAPVWWRIHGKLQYVGVATMTAGIICIFVRVGWMTSEYLESTNSKGLHEILGIVSFSLTLSQPVFALLRNGLPSCQKDTQHKVHHIWHWVHGIAGYGALGTAVLAVGIGIEEYQLKAGWPALFTAGYATSLGALFIYSVWGLARSCQLPKNKNKNNNKRESQLGEPLLVDSENGMPAEEAAEADPTAAAKFVWGLLVLTFIGAVLCSVSLIMSKARDN